MNIAQLCLDGLTNNSLMGGIVFLLLMVLCRDIYSFMMNWFAPVAKRDISVLPSKASLRAGERHLRDRSGFLSRLEMITKLMLEKHQQVEETNSQLVAEVKGFTEKIDDVTAQLRDVKEKMDALTTRRDGEYAEKNEQIKGSPLPEVTTTPVPERHGGGICKDIPDLTPPINLTMELSLPNQIEFDDGLKDDRWQTL